MNTLRTKALLARCTFAFLIPITLTLVACSGGGGSNSSSGGGTSTTSNEWTLAGGSTTVPSATTGQKGTYGTKGTASTSNIPGGRYEAARWKDSSGNFWLFGGNGTDASSVTGSLNDLWKYIPTAGTWTWVSGNSTVNAIGTYGTLGTSSSSNVPGARVGAMTWADSSGNLWMFGGEGYDSTGQDDLLNDLWKFNPTAGTWTWVSGSSTVTTSSNYGSQGTGTSSTVPGARWQASTWIDTSGNLWLFGGYGYGSGVKGYLNDFWKFSPTAGTWTWVGGSNAVSGSPIYGTQGTGSTTTIPGARYSASAWVDSSGNFWMFGGYGYGSSNLGNLNDLWEYNVTSAQWIWISGSGTTNVSGKYGTKGTSSSTTLPGTRADAVAWIDSSSNIWIFGGNGNDSTATDGPLNDLWKFSASNSQWTWVGGSDEVKAKGTYTSGSTSNFPGARESSVSWIDSSGNLYLFGGLGYDTVGTDGELNDLWKYTP